ncbi:MAG: glycosyltransferase [Lachnospiraceae bacterium]|nr:glycosyltransferase [Lachnospiraceae bacterium]
MNQPLISVIVPVYNVEKYLARCVESILAQTYRNLEVILVDDGSTDNSGEACDAYAGKDVRVKTVHKSNGGLSDARNAGLQIAQGEYYAFVDSDDWVTTDYVAQLYNFLHQNHAQIAVCGYRKVYGKEENSHNGAGTSFSVYDSREGLFHLLYQRGMISSAWGRLFKAELFHDICFPKGKLHEDVAVMYRLFDKADKIVCTDAEKYFYFQRGDSIVNRAFDRRRLDYIYFTGECIRYMEEKHPDLTKAAVSRHFSACFDILSSMGREKKNNMDAYRRIVHEIKKYRKMVLFDTHARLKNRLAAAGSYISVPAVWKLSHLISRP